MHRRCRCHGLSGVCQFQTCWDQLQDFSKVTSRLRIAYLSGITRVEVANKGSYESPDLYLARVITRQTRAPQTDIEHESALRVGSNATPDADDHLLKVESEVNGASRFKPGELIYLYESPDYCEAQTYLGHSGTIGRSCAPMKNLTFHESNHQRILGRADSAEGGDIEVKHIGPNDAPGSCEFLCCDRGYHSELVLDMVTCNCRFRYCCKIDCEFCLKQRMQHYCL